MKYLFGLFAILFSTLIYADTVTCYLPNTTPIKRSGTVQDGKNGFYILNNNGKYSYLPIDYCIVDE